jgi:hypothetical protein
MMHMDIKKAARTPDGDGRARPWPRQRASQDRRTPLHTATQRQGGRYSRILAEDFCYAVLGRLLRRCEVVPINDPSHRLKKRLIALDGEAGVG